MLNMTALYKRMMQDEKLVKTVLQAFFEDLPQQISHLHDAADNKDFKVLVRGAHKLRGAAGNVGAEKLQQLLDELEVAAGKNDGITVAQLMEHLEILHEKMKKTAVEFLH